MSGKTGARCESCGAYEERSRGGSVVQPHNYGCADSLRAKQAEAAKAGLREHARNLVEPDFAGSLCGKDGCSAPRAVSKGPRPAKFCAEHKTTNRSK